jgi:hypothetical protein
MDTMGTMENMENIENMENMTNLHIVETDVEMNFGVGGGLQKGGGHAHSEVRVQEIRDDQAVVLHLKGAGFLQSFQCEGEAACGHVTGADGQARESVAVQHHGGHEPLADLLLLSAASHEMQLVLHALRFPQETQLPADEEKEKKEKK